MFRASLVFTIRGRVRVLGLGFCVRVRVRVSVTGSVKPMPHTPHFDAESWRRKSAPISGLCVKPTGAGRSERLSNSVEFISESKFEFLENSLDFCTFFG